MAYERGDLESALEGFGRAGAIFEVALGSEHPTLAQALERSGRVKLELGDAVGALSNLRRALEIRRATLPSDSSVLRSLEEEFARVRAASEAT